jgi:hypothetical protein
MPFICLSDVVRLWLIDRLSTDKSFGWYEIRVNDCICPLPYCDRSC